MLICRVDSWCKLRIIFFITDDSSEERLYMKYNFENIEKVRDIKLKELGI